MKALFPWQQRCFKLGCPSEFKKPIFRKNFFCLTNIFASFTTNKSRWSQSTLKYTGNPSKLIEKIFLIWEICSQIKKISEYFSQNKKRKLTENNFLFLLQEIWLEITIYLKIRLIFLIIYILRKLFSARKYFLLQENCSYFKTIFLN